MAEIEEITAPIKKLGKKKGMLLVGAGVGVAVLALAFKGSKNSPEMIGDVGVRDQSVGVLGTQLSAMESGMAEQQDTIDERFSAYDEQMSASLEAMMLLGDSFAEYKVAMSEQQEALIGQLLELQQKQQMQFENLPIPQGFQSTKSSKKVTSSDGTYTGYSSEGYMPVGGVHPVGWLNSRGEYMFENISSAERDAFIAVNGRGPGLGGSSSGGSSKKSSGRPSGWKSSSEKAKTGGTGGGKIGTVTDSNGNVKLSPGWSGTVDNPIRPSGIFGE